jgi:protocatechuate 3,4-dioxygenase beta subunit
MNVVFAAILGALLFAASQQTPARDSVRTHVIGTARVSGSVVTDERPPRPVRRAIVTISGSPLPVSRSTITDDGGHFEFRALPAGRFTVTAARRAFVTTGFGAKRAGRPGTPISVADGAHAQEVRITLPRGAVLTGVITDPNGAPVPSLPVSVFRVSPTYTTAGQDLTDDRGMYRVYGLPPGDYVVAAVPRPSGVGEMGVMSEKEVDAALRALEQRGSVSLTATRPGAAVAAGPESDSPRRAYSFAPFYYPGTAVAAEATKITVATGDERGGLDFTLGVVPTAAVAGVVTGADGQPARDVQLTILGSGPSLPLVIGVGTLNPIRTGPDGTFQFASVTPGSYRITGRRVPGSPAPQPGVLSAPTASTGRGPTTEWAVSEVTVNGDDIAGLSLTLQPGLRLTGRLTFEGTATLPSNLSSMQITLVPSPAPARSGGIAPVSVKPDGTFEITNLLPGAYSVGLTMPDSVAKTWWPRAAVARGRDVLDLPIDLAAIGDAPDIVFTLSDRRPSLSGTVAAANGEPVPDAFVIVFSADRIHWHAQSRRIRVERPATDGQYRIADLPPGDYFVTAVEDAEPDEWFERAFLERLVPGAVRVTIAEGEQKPLDVRRAPPR